jgi:hypothetical protein
MVKCGVLFEVRTEFLNIIYTNFSFKGLKCFTIHSKPSIPVVNLVLKNVTYKEKSMRKY